MILLVALVLVVVSVPLAGGRLTKVLRLRIRWQWLIPAALVIQTVIISLLASILPGVVSETLHLATYAMAAGFVWRNRHIAWLWLAAVGAGLNLAAIATNHGVMPASGAALARAGMAVESGFANSAAVDHARLAFLGDVFAIPRGVPLANVFSIGDVVLVVGVALLLHSACRVEKASSRRDRVRVRMMRGADFTQAWWGN